MLRGSGFKTADAGADDDAYLVLVGLVDFKFGVLHGLDAGRHGELGEAVHAAGGFAVDVVGRLEALDLAGKLHFHIGSVEERDVIDAVGTGDEGVPGGGEIEPEGGKGADAGNDDSGRLRVDSGPPAVAESRFGNCGDEFNCTLKRAGLSSWAGPGRAVPEAGGEWG